MRRIAQIAAKSKFTRVQHAAHVIGEPNRVGRLGERNVRRIGGHVPVGMSRVPLVGDVRANLATESIEIEFDPETLPGQMRKIDSNRFDIEAAGKRESGEWKSVG